MNSVMDQLDSLLELRRKCDEYQRKHGPGFLAQIDDHIGGTEAYFKIPTKWIDCLLKYVNVLTVCEKQATKMFQEVLARKDRADVTRNALSGYQRFRFLFSLPGTMEKSIQRGEFENAISDYSRSKTLFDQPETDKPVSLYYDRLRSKKFKCLRPWSRNFLHRCSASSVKQSKTAS